MRRILTTLLICLISLAATPRAEAQSGGGAIVLSTTLLTVEPRQRTATVSVANRTATPQRYRISVVDMVMGADGQVSASGDGAPAHQGSARSWVIATPKSLSLEPGQSQTVRLLFRRPADHTDNKYRAHLKVAQEPPATIAGGLEEKPRDGGMQINIVTVYSTSIPIVFKQGEVGATASIADARLVEPNSLSLTIERQGNASFRGFARATAGDAPPVNLPVTVYPERDEVTRTFRLDALASAEGPLTLTLHEGLIPRESEEVTSAALGTVTVAR